MNAEPALEEWNLQHIALSQALLGVISSNIRMVWLEYQNNDWVVHFTLERDDTTDRGEIEDAITQFEALQDHGIACRVEVIVETNVLAWPAPPARVVFRRRD